MVKFNGMDFIFMFMSKISHPDIVGSSIATFISNVLVPIHLLFSKFSATLTIGMSIVPLPFTAGRNN